MYSIVLLIIVGFVSIKAWDYEDIGAWANEFELCNSSYRQSPVHIYKANVTYVTQLEPITISVVGTSNNEVTVMNNGHTLVVNPPSDAKYYVNFQPNENRFQVLQFHFHWGIGSHGSEHEVDGKFYNNEIHIVTVDTAHYNASDSNIASYPNSLAVFGWFYEFVDNSSRSTTLDQLLTAVPSIIQKNTSTTLSGFNWVNLLPAAPAEKYYRYTGSLTTPPCTENVMWTVVATPTLPITQDQLTTMRRLLDVNDKALNTNYRPVQAHMNVYTSRSDIVYRVVYGSYTAEEKRRLAQTTLSGPRLSISTSFLTLLLITVTAYSSY